jgi:hypothetical protein
VLFAAEADHYVTQLPLIQERLVEILRTPTVFPKITAEVGPTICAGYGGDLLMRERRCIFV